jgi:hypothetical protein
MYTWPRTSSRGGCAQIGNDPQRRQTHARFGRVRRQAAVARDGGANAKKYKTIFRIRHYSLVAS